MKKRGQITIFIILAIIIVMLGILIYLFYPQISSTLGFGEVNPPVFMQDCVEDDIKKALETLSPQGGSLEPEHYIMYQDEKIEYLCYSQEYYKTCVMQQPMLKTHIEIEIQGAIKDKANECLDSMKKSYEKMGYKVNLNSESVGVELLPKKVIAKFENSFTLTKQDTKTYDSINVVINNNLYELVSITNSILNMEARYGDSETTIYMDYYHDLKVEKKKQSEGSTIYILTDRNTGDKFQFASRSVAWPPGYGADKVLLTSAAIRE